MTFTYSSDPATTPLDELRFTLQDTDPGFPLMQDEELQYLMEQWLPRYDSLIYVAAIAADTVARKFTGIVSVSADGVSVSTSDLAQRYRDMATGLRAEYKAAQVGWAINIDNLLVGSEMDQSIRPLRFGVGLHDNDEAGSQDYGGRSYDAFSVSGGYNNGESG